MAEQMTEYWKSVQAKYGVNMRYNREMSQQMVRTWWLYTATGTLAACYIWALANYFVQTFGTTLFMYMAYWAGKFIVEVVIKKTFMGGDDAQV